MPVKRSRIGRSSSSIDTDRLSHVSSAWEVRAAPPPSAAVKPPKCLKPSLPENSAEQLWPLPRVLTLISPIQESNFDAIGGFLENCYNCTKKISQNDEVFMYSDLRAFCTARCRDSQIVLDKEMEKQAETSKVVAQAQRVNNVREVRATPPSTVVKLSKCLKPFVTSPVEESQFVVGEFLENCYFCKKKINHNEEVFMYSDLRAFCTLECRDSQIGLEKKMEKQAAKSEVVTQGQMVNKLKG